MNKMKVRNHGGQEWFLEIDGERVAGSFSPKWFHELADCYNLVGSYGGPKEVERKLRLLERVDNIVANYLKGGGIEGVGAMRNISPLFIKTRLTIGDLKPEDEFLLTAEDYKEGWRTNKWKIPKVSSGINQGATTRFVQNVETGLISLRAKSTPCERVEVKPAKKLTDEEIAADWHENAE